MEKNKTLLQTLIDHDMEYLIGNIIEKNNYEISLMLDKLINVPDIQAVFVYDANGKILSSKINTKELKYLDDIQYELLFNRIPVDRKNLKKYNIFNFIHKIQNNDEVFGYIQIYYSLKKISATQNMFLLTIISVFLAIFISMTVVMNLLLSRSIIKPIVFLRDGMKKIIQHDFGKMLKIKHNDEIGDLTVSFNSMSVELDQTYKSVELKNKELNKIQSYLNNIIQSIPSVIISVNSEKKISQWNQAAIKLFNLQETESLGKNFFDVLPFLENYKEAIENVLTDKIKQEFLKIHIFGDINSYYNLTFIPLIENDDSGMLIKIDDMTEIEKKEAQLRQAQKMETIGTLAGGLAHDLNNVLLSIIGSISLLKFQMNKDEVITNDNASEYLDLIESSGKRATDMVKHLLALSSKHDLVFMPVDLNESLKHVIKMCHTTFDKSIEITLHPYNNKPLLKGDPTLLEQVFLNLCINAAHAMTIMRKKTEKHGGKLTVTIENFNADENFIRSNPEADPADYWLISINDTGIGIDKKLLSKIFDPFFTTKEKGRGSGLGLTMAYNIIKQHEGFINVYSEPGSGTSFKVYLPQLKIIKDQEITIKKKQTIKTKGTVLIADDEENIRKIAGIMLKECGYKILYASNGEEAVNVFKEKMNEIDFILLDLAMPKMSGRECFINIITLKHDVKVLLTSGFGKDERVQEILDMGAKRFISKPYTMSELIGVIKDL